MPDPIDASMTLNATGDAADTGGAPAIIADDGTVPEVSYVPGIVEIQLQDTVRPNLSTGRDANRLDSSTVDMGALNQALEELNVQSIVFSFRSIAKPSDSGAVVASAMADPAVADLPDLSNFLTVSLTDDADVTAAAVRLRLRSRLLAARFGLL